MAVAKSLDEHAATFAEPTLDEVAEAKRVSAVTSVVELVCLLRRIGGSMKPEDQETLWRAEALIVAQRG